MENVQEEPGLEVLVVRLFEAQLRGPLDVVAFIGRIDARLFHRQRVELLYRLQLDVAATGQPGGNDVLAELRMGARGRTDRIGRREVKMRVQPGPEGFQKCSGGCRKWISSRGTPPGIGARGPEKGRGACDRS